jgi:DDE superfamily endonuclease/Helix-turn-helix of DDE superfamily endonuclease
MMNFEKIRTRPRVFQRLTGFTVAAFEALLAAFDRAYYGDRQQRDRGRPTPRQRRHGGGRKGALPTSADKLVFLLFYFRHYPTQETLAFLFGFSQGQACQWIHRLTPIVNRALGSELQLPARQPAELHEVLVTCPGLEFIIDGTERPIRRPRDRQRRRDDYSGKQKRHTKKNIVITDKPTGKIVGLGPTQVGSRHDKACVDDDGYVFPEGSTLSKDSGFQGYEPGGVTTDQPTKKPRGKDLTPEQKEANRLISRVRVKVEHSIGGVKVFGIVHDTFRNLKEGFVDLVMETICGLFNLRLASRALT